MSDPKTTAIKAAMSVGRDVAEGRMSPAALEAAAVEECRALVGRVIGPDDALWGLQLEVCRGVLAAGGVAANELAEWLAVAQAAEVLPPATVDEFEREPSWIENALALGLPELEAEVVVP